MLPRLDVTSKVTAALRRAPVVLLLGPRQCGKTTLARTLVDQRSVSYFDLESPDDLSRMSEPMTALSPLRGLCVIDEVQRLPDLFPVLRVLADRTPCAARFLVLGSASPAMLRQSSESLAGRVEIVELGPLTLGECGGARLDTRWLRGGYPRAVLARSTRDASAWMANFITTLIERDLPSLDSRLASGLIRRMWTMFAHYHGQTVSYSSIASSLGIPASTVRHHLDLMSGLLVIRQLKPWFENLGKRQVKSPRLYFRDTGMLHSLLGIDSPKSLLSNPRCGASWETLVIEELLARVPHSDAYWWSTHQGAEIDLVLFQKGRRFGVEIKRADAAAVTPSIRIAKETLGLSQVTIVNTGEKSYPLARGIKVVAIRDLIRDPSCILKPG